MGIARHGTRGTLRRKVWPAAYARSLAVRWFELTADPEKSEVAARCSWCRKPIDQADVSAERGDPCCSLECAAAVHVAGLYLR